MTQEIRAWSVLAQEQTPDLKIDKDGRRCWGYKRFKLSHLISFANRIHCKATVHSPYVYLEKVPEKELPTTVSATEVNHESEEEEDDDDWKLVMPKTTRPKTSYTNSPIIKKIRTSLGDKRADQASAVISHLSYIPVKNITMKFAAPFGNRTAAALMFKIIETPIIHEALVGIDRCENIKDTVFHLMGSVTNFKVVLK